MNGFLTFLQVSGPDWLWTFADATVKSAALLAGAGLLVASSRRASAAMRHLVWTVALVATLAVPVLSGRLPAIAVSLPQPLAALVGAPATTADISALDLEPTSTRQAPTARETVAALPNDAARETQASAPGSAQAPPLDWPTLLFLIWGAGAAIVLLRLAIGLGTAWWISRDATPIDDAGWRHLAHDLSDRLGLVRSVRLLRSARASVPMTWGWSRPVILLPVDADEWPTECRTAVLAHELAHVQRRDCAVQAIAQLACAIHWFNPMVWLAARRLRVERERACDDQVLAMGTRPSDYAAHLLDIAQSQPMEWAAATTMAMARRSELEGRLMAILDPDVRRVIPRALRGLTVAAIAVFALALAAVEPSARTPTSDTSAPIAQDTSRVEAEIEDLEIALEDADVEVAAELAEAIGEAVTMEAEAQTSEVSDRVVEAFITALGDPEASVREQAASALSRVRDDRALAALADALTSDSDADVRSTAAWALGRARRTGSADALAAALDDDDADVRQQAAWALGNMRSRESVAPLVAALGDSDPDVQEQAAWALGTLRDPAAIDGLRAALANGGDGARQQSAWALGTIRDAGAVAALVAALDDEDGDVQQQAAWALGTIRDASAVEGLVAALMSATADARQQAAWALGNMRAEQAIEGLVAALDDQDGDVQQQAAWALGNIRGATAVADLVAALDGADADARQQAAWALGRLRSADAIDGLVAALTDADEDVREQAAWALGQIRDSRATDALVDALDDADADVRGMIIEALGRSGRSNPNPNPNPNPPGNDEP